MIKKYDKRADDPHELDFDKVLLEGRGYITFNWEGHSYRVRRQECI